MTIQQLKYVIKTVECGSITEAARQLFISQPSLSAALKDIETEFGIEIFYRTSKGISLSPDGIEFLSYARQIVEQAELLEQRYNNKKPSKQLCSVSTQHYAFAVNAFVNLISSLSAEEYEFTLRETRTYEIIDVKLEGKAAWRNYHFQRDCECIPGHAKRAFYRSIAEKCSIHYHLTQSSKRRLYSQQK